MKQGVRPQPNRSANVPLYRGTFIKRVFQLLKLGYDTLTPAQFARAQEEIITGQLIRAIDSILDDPPPAIGEWADSYWAQEEQRVQHRSRHGKRRLRIDISIHSSRFRPRAHFYFEAKRLGKRHNIHTYLGSDGLGAYLAGHYANAEYDAGMLGYVQSKNEEHWTSKLEDQLSNNAKQYGCATTPGLSPVAMVAGLQFTFLSVHSRIAPMPSIRIYHLLLMFR